MSTIQVVGGPSVGSNGYPPIVVAPSTPVRGVPAGGVTGEILAKVSDTNFDVGWVAALRPVALTQAAYDALAEPDPNVVYLIIG